MDHVLQAQELLEAPVAPISVPLPRNAEAGRLGLRQNHSVSFLGPEDLSGLLTPDRREAHMQVAWGPRKEPTPHPAPHMPRA